MKVYMLPTPTMAASDLTNSIHQIVLHLQRELPKFGIEIVEDQSEADITVAHAGQTDGVAKCDVAHVHGLYPTAIFPGEEWHWSANTSVINNVKQARKVTVPSEWVADLFRRDMHIDPKVIGWAINPEDWQPVEHQNYVLWNKTRVDGVCDPTPMIQLAKLCNNNLFLTTYGNGTPNIKTVGRQPFNVMKDMVQHAQVYLATTKETFGIGTLEAMACGIPVLGYKWGATAELVHHGKSGFLVHPGDIEGLRRGLDYCIANRAVLGLNAQKYAGAYTWENIAKQFSEIYYQAFEETQPKHPEEIYPKVSVVIPCHNYARYVDKAILSVLSQEANFAYELIVVEDSSTDESLEVIKKCIDGADIECGYATVDFGNPADTRNHGIHMARGEYIVCLDADDLFGNNSFLQTLADELDRDRTLGIAFTGLKMINEDGSKWAVSNWPQGYDFEEQINRKNQVPTCCMFRREAWVRAGGYHNRYVPAEDADLWTRMLLLGYTARQVTYEPWFLYRWHDQSLSTPVRQGKVPDINWIEDKGYLKSKNIPFASDGNPLRGSWPVRNYDQPLVSFIVPVGPYHVGIVAKAIDSIERQTETQWEIIVVNDSGLSLHDLKKSYPFVRVIETPGGCGASYARNRGIEAAKAPLVSFLDADDELDPEFLQVTLVAYQHTSRYVYSDWYSREKGGSVSVHETATYAPQEVFRRMSMHSINVLIPKSYCMDVGMFDENMHTWEDVDFFMKLAAKGLCGIRVNRALVTYDYNTGKLREIGEEIKEGIKSLLRDRYGDYIKGVKMCGCLNGGDLAGQGTPLSNNMIKIQYQGAIGTHQVTGVSTKSDYGRRQRGDVFRVDRIDVEASPDMFTPIQDILVIEKAEMPPTPELV